jgi:hypothetical protein
METTYNKTGMFRVLNIKKYTVQELYDFRAKAILSQGSGRNFSQMLDNRIEMIKGQLIRKGEKIKY